jgi:hypothetical protein
VGEAGDFKCLKGSTSSPVLEEGGVFLLAPSRSLLPAFNFWTRAGMCRVPGRRRMGVGFKIGLGGTYPPALYDLSTSAPSVSAGLFFIERGALNSSSRGPQSSRFHEPEVLLRSLGLFLGLGPGSGLGAPMGGVE